jgi:GH25 family lysozyme M1 (1,4-beta-N-acetylmuramidase)
MNRRLFIVDVYEGDHVLNLAVMAEDVNGVMLKATEGLTINDQAMRHRRRLLDHGGFHYPSYITDHVRPDRPIGAGLWLASYGRDDGTDHDAIVPPPWH